jgi:hypothetical protein
MKKNSLLTIFALYLLMSFAGFSCGKDDEALTNYEYFLNTYINNVKYTTNSVSTVVLSNQPGCISTRTFNITNIGQINVDSFFLDCYFKHYSKNTDFAAMKVGSYKIIDAGQLLSSSGCNGDLVIGLVDNSIPSLFNNTIIQPTNIVHTITSIAKKDSTANSITYVVSGNFSCNFKNTNNRIIPVVGSYKMPVKAAK